MAGLETKTQSEVIHQEAIEKFDEEFDDEIEDFKERPESKDDTMLPAFVPVIPKELKREVVGRPTVMTKDVLLKLEYAFAIGCNDPEACLYAGISKTTLYEYQKKHPEFTERKEALKENPMLLARQTIAQNLFRPHTARWFAERKRKDEFAPRVEQAHSGTIIHELKPEEEKLIEEVLDQNIVIDADKTPPQSETDTVQQQPSSTDSSV